MKTAYAICSAPLIRLPVWGETDAVLMEDWHVDDVFGFRFVVPAGSTTDGASIPRFLWRLCGHPLQAPRVYAAMLHDWLYAGVANDKAEGANPGDIMRRECDLCYWALLRHFGVSAWIARIEYIALRLFGASHYQTSGNSAGKNKEQKMKKMMMVALAACAVAITGCKSIEVKRHAARLATVENADGTVSVVKDAANNPVILDGGWEVDYFQHWNRQKFDSLSAKAGQGVSLDINNYEGGADATNLTALVAASFDGGTKLATAIGEAYVKIAGGGAQADAALSTASKVIQYFKSKGGDTSKAAVSTDTAANTLKVDDGTTCVQCDAQGNCTDCTPSAAK